MTGEQVVRTGFAGVCAYEALAISTGRVPTVSALCRRRRWVEAGLLAFLVVHLHVEVKEAAMIAAHEAVAEMNG